MGGSNQEAPRAGSEIQLIILSAISLSLSLSLPSLSIYFQRGAAPAVVQTTNYLRPEQLSQLLPVFSTQFYKPYERLRREYFHSRTCIHTYDSVYRIRDFGSVGTKRIVRLLERDTHIYIHEHVDLVNPRS